VTPGTNLIGCAPEANIRVSFDIPKWVEWPVVLLVLLYRRVRYGYAFRRIPLTRGKYAIVDPDDYERLSRYRWSASKSGKNWYALRREWSKRGKRNERCIYMHREVIEVGKGKVVDHINRKSLDNRKSNLRAATAAQNMWNRRKQKKGKSSSRYKGVGWVRHRRCWRAEIWVNGERSHLGYFEGEVEAAKVYDQAAKKFHGEFAVLNLPADKGA
jgi:hypothetical protein